ncbi:hypothetical protein CMO93_03205 [Candidatus Woesearchaeota archaeon]|nr:hypothetical protein [Candidatus Woesearchaeota archaeon]|tara:strand:- start:1487 stop:2551 length:1065 start_codon:yes stop_codon:yes gene_type:complete
MKRTKGWIGLDIAKFICVALMIFIHSVFWIVTTQDEIMSTQNNIYPIIINLVFLGLFPMSIPAVAGASLRIHFSKYWKNNKIKGYPFKHILKVSSFIIILGFIMNFLAFGIEDLFSWDALQFIGISFITITLLLKFFSISSVFFAGALTLFTAEIVRNSLSDYNSNYLAAIFIGNSSGFFFWPFFPWFSTITFGFLAAHYYIKYKDNIASRIIFIITGLLLLGISFLRKELLPVIDSSNVWGATIFQPKVGFILAIMGSFSLLIVFSNLLSEKIHPKKYGIINSYSKGILWIYILHIIIGFNLSLLFKALFSPLVAIILLLLVLFLISWGIGIFTLKFVYGRKLVFFLRKVKRW